MAYKIGETTFFKGDEVTINTEAYELYGALWQDGTLANGKTVTVAAPESVAKRVQETQNAWSDQQAAFSRLTK